MKFKLNTHEQGHSIYPYWRVSIDDGRVAEAMHADLQIAWSWVSLGSVSPRRLGHFTISK